MVWGLGDGARKRAPRACALADGYPSLLPYYARTVLYLRTSALQKCGAVPRRARISGS